MLLRIVFGHYFHEGDVVLDVGSADGPSVGWVRQDVWRIPLDVNVEGLPPGAVCGSGLALPFRDHVFDVAMAFDVIEHYEDEERGLQELRRVLRHDGLLMVAVPAYMWAWTQFDVQAGHYRRYTRKRLKQALVENGFEPLRLTYAFAGTLPFFAADRLRARLGGESERPGQSRLPRWVTGMLSGCSRLDRWWLVRGNLPVGSSVFALARRR